VPRGPRAPRHRFGRIQAPDTSLLLRILAAFVLVLALSSVVTLLLETRITRQQLSDQAVTLFGEVGDVLEARISGDARRINQLMSTEAQTRFGGTVVNGAAGLPEPAGPVPVGEVDRLAVQTISVVRTAEESVALAGVVDGETGRLIRTGLTTRDGYAAPSPAEARALVRGAGASQRVVPLRSGGFGVAYVLPVRRLDDAPRLLVVGYALDTRQAQRYREQAGVDDVEIVVDGAVVATTAGAAGAPPSGDPRLLRTSQPLEDGRLVRYVALGADRPWDAPAFVGLISDDPLNALDDALAQTRVLMVALLLIVGGSLAFALARIIVRPLSQLTETATAIAGGDLDREFQVERGDEIGQLATSLEQMRRALRAQLLVIRQQADALQEAARRIVGVQDRERQRVAQDLHDGIQQQLVVLRMQVGVAATQLSEEPERREEIVAGLAGSIDALLDQLRSTGQGLFPSILRDRGLGAAMFSLASRAGVPVDVVLEPDPVPRVDDAVEMNAYFLAAEAVANALKHARAQRIRVRIGHEGTVVRVVVEDDGIGFEPRARGHRGGLVHMRDRVNAMGGSLEIATGPGEGTTVTAVFPLPARAEGGTEVVGRTAPTAGSQPGSAAGALEVEQDRGDAAVEVELLGQAELPEDGVGVLLDRSIGDGELPGDGRVPPP
jgi:signal transduction histidine kinase